MNDLSKKTLLVMQNKKNKMKHMDYHNRCMQTGETIGGYGLCHEALCGRIDPKTLELFEPTDEDKKWLIWEGKSVGYWGIDGPYDYMTYDKFTPLRQTIVLFMAAMNGEL